MTKKEAKEIAGERGLTGLQMLVFLVLAGYSGMDDMCAVTYKAIAQNSKAAVNAVKVCVKALEKAGHIGILRSNCGANTYVLLRGIGASLPVTNPYGRYAYVMRHGSGSTLISNDKQLNTLKKTATGYRKIG